MSEKTKRKFRFPILVKTILLIFVFAMVIVEIAMTYYSLVMQNRNIQTYSNFADSLSATTSEVVNKDDCNTLQKKIDLILDDIPINEIVTSEEEDESKLETYMDHFASLEEDSEFTSTFNRVRDSLRKIAAANEDFYVTSIYLAHVHEYLDENNVKQGFFVYLVDSAEEEDTCPPGWVDPLYEQNHRVLDEPSIGFPAYTTDTSYGYLITSGTLVKDTDMVYATVDVSMDAVRAKQAESIIRLFIYLFVTVNLIAIAGVVIVQLIFTKQIRKLNTVASSFDDNDPAKSHEQFENLKIGTHDELAELADSMKKMEQGVHERINQLVKVNQDLIDSQMQTAKMSALANKDPLTGVKSKIAYHLAEEELNEQIASDKKPTFGLAMIDLNYLKNTNDEFGHVAGDEAIVKLANLICLTFKHSPVYRFGGDEFVVILKDTDFKQSKILIDEFNERIDDAAKDEKTPLYKRVAAALGYAVFDPKIDHKVEDVFARADQEMYKRKHDMKE